MVRPGHIFPNRPRHPLDIIKFSMRPGFCFYSTERNRSGVATVLSGRRALHVLRYFSARPMSEKPFIENSIRKGQVVLAIDDDENNLMILKRPLVKSGYKFLECSSGRRALEMLKTTEVDLILLDWMMPVITGPEICRILKEDPAKKHVPIIMLTAKDSPQDLREGLEAGANDYLTKPYNQTELLARVRAALREKEILQRLKDSNDQLTALNERINSLNKELELRNSFIKDVFGRYTSDEIVETLLESPEGLSLGGEKRKVTVLMADLRGFTSLSEKLPPEQVVKILNNYLSKMTEVIDSYGGTIDEFIGDAILAIFGAPTLREDDAQRAVACAVMMQRAMEEVNATNAADSLPAVEMGVAINTGEVIVGNIGSHRRAKYGVVGKSVNLTSRIESLTVGGQILVSESTFAEVGPDARTVGTNTVSLKGVSEPVTVYDIGGIGGRHDVNLPEKSAKPLGISGPIPVLIRILEDKFAQDDIFPGKIVKLSEIEAHVETDAALGKFDNVEIWSEAGKEDARALGKTMSGAGPGAYIVRFTFFPDETRASWETTTG